MQELQSIGFSALKGASGNDELAFSVEKKPAAFQPLRSLLHLEYGILVLMTYHNSALF